MSKRFFLGGGWGVDEMNLNYSNKTDCSGGVKRGIPLLNRTDGKD